jgi:hypothetical protein
MTAQIAERLTYKGEEVSMCTTPLSEYFTMSGFTPRFKFNGTALWRGYVGNWEVVDSRLYLTGLTGTLIDGTEVSLATFFPAFPDRVFAHWYSGEIRIPQGKLIKYLHRGYRSVFERDLFLDVERGMVVATRERHNGTAESKIAPDGYKVGAMTVFSRADKHEE